MSLSEDACDRGPARCWVVLKEGECSPTIQLRRDWALPVFQSPSWSQTRKPPSSAQSIPLHASVPKLV